MACFSLQFFSTVVLLIICIMIGAVSLQSSRQGLTDSRQLLVSTTAYVYTRFQAAASTKKELDQTLVLRALRVVAVGCGVWFA